jgi:hypothetical protein
VYAFLISVPVMYPAHFISPDFIIVIFADPRVVTRE